MSRKYIADKLQELLHKHIFETASFTRDEVRVVNAAIIEIRKNKEQ